ncbi:MAPK/MAK/MRK overlapping kinase isoform X2 [Protopterus annectens]|uniref:MAPK/MAK/MRK overlapping kinase isoform X2 n=1 Tax=Protopterus annectens TaxID=7888 RepID=UPI001CFAB243|nr:MAPK/MAK/MRK overlapping kinase isoform X2 [Protopterus annectens]
MNSYKIISKIGEGTFSDVMKIQSYKDGNYYACKKMKQRFESAEQVNSLREVQALRRLSPHPNILRLHEVIFDKTTCSLALICELMDKNIYELIRGRRHPLPEKKIKNYMFQLCKSLDHMHRNGIFHRDVKPENILIKNDVLKLADFGSCRSVYSKQPFTEYISTRWYRAPECLLTDGFYGYKMDVWSAGCVLFEITSFQPLFPGLNEVDQISKIHDILGTPDSKTLSKFKQSRAVSFDFPFKKGSGIPQISPSFSEESLSVLYAMLEYDPDMRITARDAMQHPYFADFRVGEKQNIAVRSLGRGMEGTNKFGTSGSMDSLWKTARQGRRQYHLKHLQEPLKRYHGPSYPVELPTLTVPGASKMASYPSPTFQPVFPTLASTGALPIFQTMKYIEKTNKPENQQYLQPIMKQYHLPSIDRKNGR